MSQEYGPYSLDGPPYGSSYYCCDYNLPGGRVRPGIPPPGPIPYEDPDVLDSMMPPPMSPEDLARGAVCPVGYDCYSDDE